MAWATSHDRMRREVVAAAHVGDRTGTPGTSTWLIDIVAVWRNRASRRGGWVGDGAVTEEAITPRQNVYACARLSISGHFFSHTFQSDHSPPRALGFILCAACGSVVLLHAARVFDYFVVIEIAFMDNQAQITETISRLDSEKVS